ncbi:MAG TPA: C4-type zinc ribbon domain-containing protein [Longimicrobiales bacterium]|nr:C4-type zinc ribbon domain-containing protein [Longimicrobiales bacterium]
MHPQLEILLQLQDLKSQRRELAEHDREVEEQEFHINVDDAIAELDNRISELREELPKPLQSRLARFAGQSGARAVVPVINGICYGCFSALPTAAMSDLQRNDRVNHCEHCGRFLYVVVTD